MDTTLFWFHEGQRDLLSHLQVRNPIALRKGLAPNFSQDVYLSGARVRADTSTHLSRREPSLLATDACLASVTLEPITVKRV